MTEQEPAFDLLLQGGHVVDPGNNIYGRTDVAIKDGKIAAISPDIDTSSAAKTVNVDGLYVTPGLIDIHVHVLAYGAWTFPDEYALPNGITTVADAGGAGWRNFEEWKAAVIDKARTRVLVLLNIVGAGMLGTVEQDTSEMQPEPCAQMVQRHRDVIVGIKAAHHDGPGWESVDGAVAAAELSDTFAMIDYHRHPNRTYRELLLEHMRPGDTLTHMYGMGTEIVDGLVIPGRHPQLLDDSDKIHDFVLEARRRGVRFDVGHGGGSFWFRIAKPCMDQGFGPDTISTDVHKGSFFLLRATMPITMSKLMNLGMSLNEAVDRSTRAPAEQIGRPDLGSLSVGADADVAVFELERGEFGFTDSGLARLKGDRRLLCHMTIRAGEVVWDLNGLSRPEWETQGDYVRIEG